MKEINLNCGKCLAKNCNRYTFKIYCNFHEKILYDIKKKYDGLKQTKLHS